MSTLRRVKITSNGRHTKVFFADTGEEVLFVQRIKFEHSLYGKPIVYVEQAFQLDKFDIEGESPDAMTEVEAKEDWERAEKELENSRRGCNAR